MGIGSIRGIESMPGRPTVESRPTDSVAKGIQDEISEVQRQKQQLSSKEKLPAAEKNIKRQELQQKISGLNRELRHRQADVRKEQQKEALAKESRANASEPKAADNNDPKTKDAALKDAAGQKPKTNEIKTKANAINVEDVKTDNAKPKATGHTDSQNDNAQKTGASAEKADSKASHGKTLQDKSAQEKTSQRQKLQDIDIPEKRRKAIVKSDASREQARKQETVIARIEGGIAILKSEIKLDEARGMDVGKKQEELKKQNEKLQKAAAAQFPSPEQLNQAAEKTVPVTTGTAAGLSNENMQAAQQPLFKDIAVSLTI